ncbi:hypothetical protein [Corynebacterium tapiri]|uniref:Uncharacterized protein n=1 Tax=Corynebacterium tapiri TaxID=1448266 RepID=A0A5C4U1X7_9CORY|nr:hypothetical protein [Corynebacterium tapiri]TNL96024.1 hypothetical protein FHE74_08305 [Corynebacterium tapiri]
MLLSSLSSAVEPTDPSLPLSLSSVAALASSEDSIFGRIAENFGNLGDFVGAIGDLAGLAAKL